MYIENTNIIIATIINFRENKQLFKSFTKKDWGQYLSGLIIAWIVAVSLIYGGKQLLQYYAIDFTLLKYCLIIGSLVIAYVIIYKMTPKKLKDSLKI